MPDVLEREITLDQILAGYGLRKGDNRDRTFAKSKEIYRSADVTQAEREARERQFDTMRKRRKRQQDKRARIEAESQSIPIDPVRMRACLTLLGNLVNVISDLTVQRYNRYRRVLGDVHIDDIAQDAILNIAEALARRTKTDIVTLAEATLWLKDAPQPYVTADGPDGARLLLGTIIKVIGNTIVDSYRDNTTTAWVQEMNHTEQKMEWVQKDTTLTSFEMLTTVAANTRTDVDTMLTNAGAKRKPAHEYQVPGMKDKRLFARVIIDTAITARGLDWLADMLLDGLRTDGTFTWTEHADAIWSGLGFPAMNTDSPRLKAAYARRAVRIAFAFLPEVVTAAYDIVTDPEVMWNVAAVVSNDVTKITSVYRPQRGPIGDICGGHEMEYTLRLLDDPTAMHRALLVILGTEVDEFA